MLRDDHTAIRVFGVTHRIAPGFISFYARRKGRIHRLLTGFTSPVSGPEGMRTHLQGKRCGMAVDPTDPETIEEFADFEDFEGTGFEENGTGGAAARREAGTLEDEVPEADAVEQRTEVTPEGDDRPAHIDADAANEADAVEQARTVGLDEDDYR
ncbi:Hypothetical protein SCLAV_4031 [Streptomyces clavuligerus]|uniref:Uncharacterized protein n=2 Tax=Streptomyces clavuligerus TaxID=1901 RepID=E2Q4U6_STRCL|nr:Hypothetical protein SCLAV_4031 [Streptomyces clavuligerus]